ncbi:MAG TPA: 50S ribosomal protein L25 [Candidatus Bathyarchaeia archaeon]|nr:50S ribosomal protein L25 [Candidatus Bathyarchaeia archaeon]
MAKKEKPKLKAEKRKITGRKVKKLRQEGVLPANVYGKKVKSCSIKLDLKTFLPVFQEVGETGIVDLNLKGETKMRPVLIHNVQLDPVTDQPLHADFHQVDLKEKVTADIPIEIAGESPAVKEKGGILIQPLTEVEVEALPAELPDQLEVNITGLKEINDAVTVADLKVPKGVKLLTAANQILAKVEPPAEEEEEAPPAEVPSEEAEEKPEEKEEKPEAPAGEKETKAPSEKSQPEEKKAKAKPEKKGPQPKKEK